MKKSLSLLLLSALLLAQLTGCGKKTDGADAAAATTGGDKGEIMDVFFRDEDTLTGEREDVEYAAEEESDENVIYVEDNDDENASYVEDEQDAEAAEDGPHLLEFENFTGGVIYDQDDRYLEVERLEETDQGMELTYKVWADTRHSGDAWFTLAVNGLRMNDELFTNHKDDSIFRGFVYTGRNSTATLLLDWTTLGYMGVKEIRSIRLGVEMGDSAYASFTPDTAFTVVLYPGEKVSTDPVMPEPANPDWVLADKEGERFQITGAHLVRGGTANDIQGVMLYYAMEGAPGNTSALYVLPPRIGAWEGRSTGIYDNTNFFFDTTHQIADIVTGCCVYTGDTELLDQDGSFDEVVLPYIYNDEEYTVVLDLSDTK